MLVYLVKNAAVNLFTEKLQLIPQDIEDSPGDQKNKDLLLYFLSENPQEPSQPKNPDEKLADILFRNLYTPQSIEAWSHLIRDSRALENTCRKERVWEMVNSVMQVSPSLLGTWVTSASMLSSHGSNDSLGVSFLLCDNNLAMKLTGL